MTVSINNVIFEDVFKCGFCDCEVVMVFNQDHKYNNFEEWIKLFEEAGLNGSGSYYFKEVNYLGEIETSVLLVIPENIRDTFQIHCW